MQQKLLNKISRCALTRQTNIKDVIWLPQQELKPKESLSLDKCTMIGNIICREDHKSMSLLQKMSRHL